MPTGKRSSCAKFATRVSAATSVAVSVLILALTSASAQATASPAGPQAGSQQADQQKADQQAGKQINVNWLYGSFVPKDVPLVPLAPHQRFRLYLSSTYTTWGIYLKTLFFASLDQVKDTPPQWNGGSGFAKRALSYQGQFIIQNSISSAGNALVGWEPRYELCRCSGIGPRSWHAVKRNFITYNSTDTSLRPQLMPYVGAAGAAAIVAVAWQPGNPNPGTKAYQAAVTQIFVGVGVNLLAEFAPDVMRHFHKDKKKKPAADQHAEGADPKQ
jgi:hypothetical protein